MPVLVCPHCSERLRVPDGFAKPAARCSACKRPFDVGRVRETFDFGTPNGGDTPERPRRSIWEPVSAFFLAAFRRAGSWVLRHLWGFAIAGLAAACFASVAMLFISDRDATHSLILAARRASPTLLRAIPDAAILTIAILAYLLPSIVASERRHPNSAPIAVINIGLGWTLVGYVAALAWAVSACNARPEAGHRWQRRLSFLAAAAGLPCIILAVIFVGAMVWTTNGGESADGAGFSRIGAARLANMGATKMDRLYEVLSDGDYSAADDLELSYFAVYAIHRTIAEMENAIGADRVSRMMLHFEGRFEVERPNAIRFRRHLAEIARRYPDQYAGALAIRSSAEILAGSDSASIASKIVAELDQ